MDLWQWSVSLFQLREVVAITRPPGQPLERHEALQAGEQKFAVAQIRLQRLHRYRFEVERRSAFSQQVDLARVGGFITGHALWEWR